MNKETNMCGQNPQRKIQSNGREQFLQTIKKDNFPEIKVACVLKEDTTYLRKLTQTSTPRHILVKLNDFWQHPLGTKNRLSYL